VDAAAPDATGSGMRALAAGLCAQYAQCTRLFFACCVSFWCVTICNRLPNQKYRIKNIQSKYTSTRISDMAFQFFNNSKSQA
jgi:hypothetical protein